MQHFLPNTIWLSEGLCPLRLIGDLCLVAATPWLLFTIHKSGIAGISVETQILRLIVFVARYLDLLIYGQTVSAYNTGLKITIVVTSLHAVTSLVLRHRAYKMIDLVGGIYRLCLPLLFAMLMATTFTYAYTFLEISWAFSQFLGIVSDIPQIILLVNPENRDWKMVVYMGLAAGYRTFYIPHWVVRYLHWRVLDPIAVFSGIIATILYLVASAMMLWKQYKDSRSRSQSPEEARSTIVDSIPYPSAKDNLNSFPREKV